MKALVCYLCWAVLCTTVWVCTCTTFHADSEDHDRHRREAVPAPTLSDRTQCNPGDPWPATRVNTTQRLADLRAAMAALHVDAFLIFSGDAHGSEYPADSDKRRAFISGFTGTAGWAVVTMTKAALWTDGRYFVEAEGALDCNWILMKPGVAGTPSTADWLISQLTTGQTVGADPFLVTEKEWQGMEKSLEKANITMTAVDSNPVDTVWTDQPEPPKTPINAWDIKYAGRSWQDKISDVHTAMEGKWVHGATVVTNLDEVAWLFNLRGNDIQYNPFFISYAVVEYYGNSSANNKISLYIYDKDTQLTRDPTDPETRDKLHVHLNTNTDGTCTGRSGMCVEVHDYAGSQVVAHISTLAAASADYEFWIDAKFCNYAIFRAIPQVQRFQEDPSYLAITKTQKNPTERQGMKICNDRDAAVLVEFFAKLEKNIVEGQNWTELSAAAELARMRGEAQNNRGISFETIAGSGPNGAIIHYGPSKETDRQLATEEMFLLDSGAQYLECTTDTTRTVHFGNPDAFQIEAYTRVLMGHIDLAMVVWPRGHTGYAMDLLARQYLWKAGLDYRHGTGHGVGAYLSVHDGPVYIGGASRASTAQVLLPYMFLSDEPGYYETGKFGVRLETVLMVESADTKHQFGGREYLHWKPIALVPYEPKLIDYSLMTNHQVQWLNQYHKLTQDTIDPLLTSDLAKQWLRERTKHVSPAHLTGLASRPLPTLTPLVLGLAVALTLFFCNGVLNNWVIGVKRL